MEKRHYDAASLARAIREFEREYGLASADFYERYKSDGDLGSIPRFSQNVWASFHEDVLRMTDGAGVEQGSVLSRVSDTYACAS